MMVRLGNFFFHYRNALFPVAYLLLFVPSPPIFQNYRTAFFLGVGVAALGQLIRAVTVGLDYIIRGGRNRRVYAERLVQGGLFAHCRNPLYVGNFTILLGVGLASNSRLFFLTGIPFFVLAYAAIIAAEENFLRGKFGAEFDEYCGRVNRLVPNFRGLSQTLEGMEFNWRRLISAEYGSAYLWMAAVVLVAFVNAYRAGEYRPGDPFIWMLRLALIAATAGYGVARYLKKSGRLE